MHNGNSVLPLVFLKDLQIFSFFNKVFIAFVTVLLLFDLFVFFGHEACGIRASPPGIEFVPPALENEVLSTGPQGSLQRSTFLNLLIS